MKFVRQSVRAVWAWARTSASSMLLALLLVGVLCDDAAAQPGQSLSLKKCLTAYQATPEGTQDRLLAGIRLVEVLRNEDIVESLKQCQANLKLAESQALPNAMAVVHLQTAAAKFKRLQAKEAREHFESAVELFDEQLDPRFHLSYFLNKFEYELIDIQGDPVVLMGTLSRLREAINASDDEEQQISALCAILTSQIYNTGERFGAQSAESVKSEIRRLAIKCDSIHGKLACWIVESTQMINAQDLNGFQQLLPKIDDAMTLEGSRACRILHETNLAMYAFSQGDGKEIRDAMQRSLQLSRELGSREIEFSTMVVLGQLELDTNNLAGSTKILEELQNRFGDQLPYRAMILDIYYRWRYSLAKRNENFKQAVAFLESMVSPSHRAALSAQNNRYRSLNFRLFEIEREKRNQEASFQQQRTGMLASLTSAEQKAKELEQNFIRLLGLAIGFLLVGGLILALLRLRTTRNQLAAEQLQVQIERYLRTTVEQRLVRMQRMESLGLLAGGIAHDFNNLLVGVIGNAEILKLADRYDAQQIGNCADQILISANKAAELSGQMLAYSGKGLIQLQVIDISQRISKIESLFDDVGSACEIHVHHGNDSILTLCDATQFDQMILNLVSNARRVCQNGGRIDIRVGTESLTDLELLTEGKLFGVRSHGGEFGFVEVADTGPGVSDEQIENIFDPFFTQDGNGRGLGLAVVYGLVVSHNGLIRVRSELGVGSQFRILLPLSDASVGNEITSESEPGSTATSRNRLTEALRSAPAERVLIVDDEPSVREWIASLCAIRGIESTVLGDGTEVVNLVASNRLQGTPFDVLILDMVMPQMNADQVLNALNEARLKIPTIVISGHSQGRLNRLFQNENVIGVLEKPFLGSELVRLLSGNRSKSQFGN